MSDSLTSGISLTSEMVVDHCHTAIYLGSGSLNVFATPALVAFMENAAMSLVSPHLTPNQTSVGIEINVKHIKASAVGAKIVCHAVLTEIDNRKLIFSVKAFENNIEIGSCIHTRFIVDSDKFMNKL
jgi:fluoroacetyl-CoA thioesterase